MGLKPKTVSAITCNFYFNTEFVSTLLRVAPLMAGFKHGKSHSVVQFIFYTSYIAKIALVSKQIIWVSSTASRKIRDRLVCSSSPGPRIAAGHALFISPTSHALPRLVQTIDNRPILYSSIHSRSVIGSLRKPRHGAAPSQRQPLRLVHHAHRASALRRP